jgi:hypothetical protein
MGTRASDAGAGAGHGDRNAARDSLPQHLGNSCLIPRNKHAFRMPAEA